MIFHDGCHSATISAAAHIRAYALDLVADVLLLSSFGSQQFGEQLAQSLFQELGPHELLRGLLRCFLFRSHFCCKPSPKLIIRRFVQQFSPDPCRHSGAVGYWCYALSPHMVGSVRRGSDHGRGRREGATVRPRARGHRGCRLPRSRHRTSGTCTAAPTLPPQASRMEGSWRSKACGLFSCGPCPANTVIAGIGKPTENP